MHPLAKARAPRPRPALVLTLLVPAALLLAGACAEAEPETDPAEPSASADVSLSARGGEHRPADEGGLFRDVSADRLPGGGLLDVFSMDAAVADLDADGDLDVLVAVEFGRNLLLLNEGDARFVDASVRLPESEHDSEDIGVADFDGDGDLDVLIVSEDDQKNELYLNEGGARFVDASERLPVEGTSNALVVADLDGDGDPDALIGNKGQNNLLLNEGDATFVDATEGRLPTIDDPTQDLELGDVDGDGDADLLVANEERNRLLINQGGGVFVDESDARLPEPAGAQHSREGDFGDVDGDGDLDVLIANVGPPTPGRPPQNRLYLNEGAGVFTDVTDERLPYDNEGSFDGDLVDLDGDGDLDVILANIDELQGQRARAPYVVYLNDGRGHFRNRTQLVLPESATGNGFDVEAADLDGDGTIDLYLASRGGADRLLLGR